MPCPRSEVRKLGMGPGIALVWADLVLPIPQTAVTVVDLITELPSEPSRG